MRARVACALLGVAAGGPAAAGEGYVIERSVESPASPAAAYRQFRAVADWWDPAHSYSGKQGRLSLSASPGGCWCETLDGGGFVEHGRVLYAEPAKAIRIAAPFGPLQPMAATAVLSMTFAQAPAGSRITMRYVVSGAGVAASEGPVGRVMNAQFDRLAARLAAAQAP